MGQLGGAMNGIKDAAGDVGDLTTKQKFLRAGIGGAAGGLQQLAKQQQPQGGGGVPIQIGQPQFVDFSQMGKRGFYGG